MIVIFAWHKKHLKKYFLSKTKNQSPGHLILDFTLFNNIVEKVIKKMSLVMFFCDKNLLIFTHKIYLF